MDTNKHKNDLKGRAGVIKRQKINTQLREQDEAFLKINIEKARIARQWLLEYRLKMAQEIGDDLQEIRRKP